MKNLLRFEYRRLFRAKVFFICMGIAALLVVLSAVTTKVLLTALESAEEMTEALGAPALQAPTALALLKGVGNSSLTLIMAIFVTIFVSEDFSGDIIKNVYSKGYTRESVFFAKYLSSLTGCLIMTLTNALLSLLLGVIFFDGFGAAGKNFAGSLIAILLLIIAFHAIYFAITISLHRTGGSIALAILAPTVISGALMLVDSLLKSDKYLLSDYWLDGRLNKMAEHDVESVDVVTSIVIALVFIAIALLIGFFVHRKREK